MAFSTDNEVLVVVDSADQEIGSERRCVIHERNLLHRAVHVLLFNREGNVLIQQRSSLKDTFPLHWECVGGHLGPGEEYATAAVREVREELGVDAVEFKRLVKINACQITGHEFIEVYSAILDKAPVPLADEVIALEWLEPEQLIREMETSVRQFNPSFRFTMKTLLENQLLK